MDGGCAPRTDNLYLDMNGVVHNCVRGNAKDVDDSERYHNVQQPVRTYEDIFLDVFKYIDNIVTIIRPRKLLYFAIDGVAPRAKMNQQRSRRFRSARERTEEHARRLAEDPMYVAAESTPFDSNCISPGTHFMQQLTEALDYYVNDRISTNPLWAKIDVVLSGAEAYGEGEHKIMEYIRAMKVSGKMLPNTRHCLYGLDADLIMLALLSHEPHFFLLREKVDFTAYWKKKGGPRTATFLDTVSFGEFELLSIGLLREYLELDIGSGSNAALPFFDIERVVDDFVFMLMLVGNDFLPHLPTVEIADGSVVAMFHLYKRLLPRMGGYLTEKGQIIPERVELFIAKLSLLELRAMKRKETEKSFRRERPGPKILFTSSDDLDEFWDFVDAFYPGMEYDIQAEISKCRKLTQSTVHTKKKHKYYEKKMGKEFAENMNLSIDGMKTHYLQGIVWTMKYYFEGCQSWRWFYPFHYAPFPSDLIDIASAISAEKLMFAPDKPFLPYQQLMSVLPPASADCVPIPYQKLMTSADSPLRDFYKEDFETDLNGKRNDWEAVVLLPFVDEDRLIEAMASVSNEELTEVERKRNTLGDSILYKFDRDFSKEVLSPFPQRLRTVKSHAKGTPLKLPVVQRGTPFPASWVDGTHHAGTASWVCDLPTLYPMPHTGRLQKASVNLFGYASKSESLVVSLGSWKEKSNGFIFFDDSDDSSDAPPPPSIAARSVDGVLKPMTKYHIPGSVEEVVLSLGVGIGSQVWTHFPWRKSGTIEAIIDWNRTVRRAQPPFHKEYTVEERTNQAEFETWVSETMASLFDKSAVDIEKPEVLVEVIQNPGSGNCMLSVPSESTVSRFPLVTILTDDQAMKDRMVDHPRFELTARIPTAGQTVLYVGPGPFFGSLCEVQDFNLKDGTVEVLYRNAPCAAREMPFAYDIVEKWQSQRWKHLSQVATRCSLSERVTNAFLGSVRVRLENGKDEIDLGLGIKYSARGLHIPGYAKVNDFGKYFFSEKAIALLIRYKEAFPELFASVERLMPSSRSKGAPIFSPRQLFPNIGSIGSAEAVTAIASWVSASEVATQPLVTSASQVLYRDAVFELERNALIALMLQEELTRSVLASGKKLKPYTVSQRQLRVGIEPVNWEADLDGRNPESLDPVPVDGSGLRVGDRVVNRLSYLGIPFGLRGTVIGIHDISVTCKEKAEKRGTEDIENEYSGPSSRVVEVVFDEEFIGGGDLNGLCNPGKGKAVPAGSLYTIRPDRNNRYYDKNYVRVSKKAKTKPANLADAYHRRISICKAAEDSYRAAIESRANGAEIQKKESEEKDLSNDRSTTKHAPIDVTNSKKSLNSKASKQSPKSIATKPSLIGSAPKHLSNRTTTEQANRPSIRSVQQKMNRPSARTTVQHVSSRILGEQVIRTAAQQANSSSMNATAQEVDVPSTRVEVGVEKDNRLRSEKEVSPTIELDAKERETATALTETLKKALGISTSDSPEESGAEDAASSVATKPGSEQRNGWKRGRQRSRRPTQRGPENETAHITTTTFESLNEDVEEPENDFVRAWNALKQESELELDRERERKE